MSGKVSRVSVFECLSFEDAWDTVLQNWFIQELQSPFKKLPQAIIVPNDSVTLLIKEFLLKNRIPILGIRFMTPGTLRHHLLNTYQYSEMLELRENLHLLMKVVAKRLDTNLVAKSAEVDPEQFVRLADLIETTGWDTDIIDNVNVRKLIEEYLKEQNRCGLVTAEKMSNKLYHRSNFCPELAFSSIMVFGFRSKHWSSYKMLLTAIRSSIKATVCLFTQDSSRLIDQAWLGSWEQEFGSSKRIFTVSEDKPFSYLSYYFDDIALERNVLQTNQLPEIYIAEDILREAEVIVAKIAQALAEEEVFRLGVVFPSQTSLLAREVSRLLEHEEIAHYNHLGYFGGSNVKQQIFESWIHWQNTPRLQGFLNFLDQLVNEELLPFSQFSLCKRQTQLALQNILTDELPVIFSYLKCTLSDSEVDAIIGQWVLLPEEASFNEYIILSQPAFETMAWPADIELVKQRGGTLLNNLKEPIKKSDFLIWLKSITKPLGRIANYFGTHPYSLVHLITEEEAILQTWSHLILSGLNQGEWPSNKPQVIFLDDNRIAELNQNSLIQGNQGEGHLTIKPGLSLLPSSNDQYAINKNNFITLLRAPSKKLILTAHTKDPKNFKDTLISEFFERTYWISEGTLLDTTSIKLIYKKTEQWTRAYRFRDLNVLLRKDAVLHAFNQRRNPDTPFDAYSFCFKKTNKEAFNLPAKVWEDMLTNPERAWFQYILGVKKNEVALGKSLNALAKGTWIHSWLTLDTHYAGKRLSTAEWSAFINNNANTVFEAIERSFSQLNRRLPDIWRANWYEAKRIAINLCHSLSSMSNTHYFFSEYTIPEISSGVLDIPLRGRIDLIVYPIRDLENKSHPLWIIDFKTGSSGTLTQNKLKRGIGLQLALYALALKVEGFHDINLSIVQPHSTLSKQIDINEVLECNDLLNTINLIYQTGKVGLRESMDKFYGRASILPLSTLKIESDIIKKKWNLTHPSLSL